MSELAMNFHFLRPWYLTGLAPVVLVLWLLRNRQDARRPWRGIVSDPLLQHLLVLESPRGKVRPWHLLALVWLLTVMALSGPAWRQGPSPFAEDKAALFIVLKVTPSMTATDIQPSRLERAVHKIRDLLALRRGALNGLIAYSGSAHLVVPLTRDGGIIEAFAAELSPDVMPAEGDALADAVELAEERLEKSGLTGSVLSIADGIDSNQWNALTHRQERKDFPVHFLATATPDPPGSPPAPALDRKLFETAAKSLGGSLSIVTPDERDVERIASRIERSLAASDQMREASRWEDSGYWLVPVIALSALMWFRRGWRLRYG